MSQTLRSVPAHDPTFKKIWQTYHLGITAGMDYNRRVQELGVAQNRFITRYGFDREADGNPIAFLRELAACLVGIAEEYSSYTLR